MIKYENANGKQIELSSDKYRLTSINGVGGPDTDVQTQKAAYQDGTTYIDTLLENRDIDFEIAIIAIDNEELYELRRHLVEVFNPKLGPGTLTYEYHGKKRKIQTVTDKAPEFPSTLNRRYQPAIVNLICPSPFWEDIKETGEPLGFIEGGLTFPLMLNPDVQEHTLFGRRGFTALLENKGDVPAPVEIIFSGPAENPKIINKTTGEFIQINETLDSDEKLHINTAFGAKRAEIEGNNGEMQNAFHYLDLESTFWHLEVGENEVDFESDISREEASVQITYRNRYVGI